MKNIVNGYGRAREPKEGAYICGLRSLLDLLLLLTRFILPTYVYGVPRKYLKLRASCESRTLQVVREKVRDKVFFDPLKAEIISAEI